MAGIYQKPNGTFVVRFMLDGERKKVTVGKSERQADGMRRGIEDLLTARKLGAAIDPKTAAWLNKLSPDLRGKLSEMGLCEPPAELAKSITIQKLLDDYLTGRTDAKPASLTVWGHTKRNLTDFFGSNKPIEKITAGDARDFERYLKRRRESIATATRKRLTASVPTPFANVVELQSRFLLMPSIDN